MGLVYLRQTILEGNWKFFDIAIMHYLLEFGNTINDKDKSGFTLLQYAAQHGQFKIVTCLLNYGADVHVRNSQGETAFMFAAAYGRIRIMELLRRYGAQINICDKFKSTALMKAVCHKRKYAVIFLIQSGVFLDAQDEKGQTALSYAAHIGEHELVELLIDKGADITKALECTGAKFVGRSFIQTRLERFRSIEQERIEYNHTMELYAKSSGFNLGFHTLLKRRFIRIIKDYLFEPEQIEFRNTFQKEFNRARNAILFSPPRVTPSVITPAPVTPAPQSSSPEDTDTQNIVDLFQICRIG